MVRLILLIILVLFVIWILRPLLKLKGSRENKDTKDRVLGSDQSNLRQSNTILIIIAVVLLFTLFLWLLPKFGINILALIQKIITIVSSLRGIFPF